MTIKEHLKELKELNMLNHTREIEAQMGNHISSIRNLVEEQQKDYDYMKKSFMKKLLGLTNQR